MDRVYIEEKQFEKIDFAQKALEIAEYENCSFIGCNFSATDMAKINFLECEFTGCNLAMAKLTKTGFRDVIFKDCKLLGLHFEDCDDFLFTATFDNCPLNLSSFYKMKLKKALFKNSMLHEVDFTEADLSGAVFDHCDLQGAIFQGTQLEKADFRSSFNYSINPEENRIKKAKFSVTGLPGLLDKYDLEIE